MINKLVIAGIRWNCNVPNAIFSESIVSFSSEFAEKEDINLTIKYMDEFEEPVGKSITNDILEWYIHKDANYLYHLIKREDSSDTILVSLKANEDWSDIVIETRCDNAIAIETINVLLVEIVFRNRLLFHDGLVIHSSAIEYEGAAVTFSAPSGTGKSTHVSLWQENYDVKVINDDHPAVRMIDGKPIIFGTPWAGEAKKFQNMSSYLKGVVILQQGALNKIGRMDNKEILKEFFPRCFLPYYNSNLLHRAVRIFNEIINTTPVYKLTCKPDQEAVETVRNYVWSEKYDSGMVGCE